MIEEEQMQEAIELSKDMLLFSRDNLLVSLRFLDRGLYQFELIHNVDNNCIGMNGHALFYHYDYVLRQYQMEKESLARVYLHMVFHCILYHPFKTNVKREEYWNLATDMITENAIMELNIKAVQTSRDEEQLKVINLLKKDVGVLTAERLYKHFLVHPLSTLNLEKYETLFKRDYHEFWKIDNLSKEDGLEEWTPMEEPMKEWEKISERVKVDLDTFSKELGAQAESLIQNIREVNKERYDYGEFLKRFAIHGENIQINEDEFDYIYYSYGMKLYGNMPLIEPLETKEVRKIKDFVIAIDTSGSCSGEVVQSFLNKTYSILTSSENFFRKVNIHIIQCDAKIQRDTKITNQEEFEDFIANIQLFGFGGTDFRPVFHYVEELIEKGEFDNLKGLIYFTDGYGKFPEWIPKYDVAFVFVDNGHEQPKVPMWAMKLVLNNEELGITSEKPICWN